MKKMVSLVLLVVMALCVMQVVSFADGTVTVGNASMTYVGANGTGYEYKVVVNVTASGTDQVSILMFGNENNNAFVTGDTLSFDLDSDGTSETYYVYYVDQAPAADGVAAFSFNVVLPDVAASRDYYIWAGSTTMERGQLTKSGMSESGEAFKISSATLVTETVVENSQISFSIELKDVFGDTSAKDVDVLCKTDSTNYTSLNGSYSNGVYTAIAPAAGTYTMIARATRTDGANVDSAPIQVVVGQAGPDASNILGDADNDGYITTMDAVKVLKVEAGDGAYLFPNQVPDTNAAVTILKHVARIAFIAQSVAE